MTSRHLSFVLVPLLAACNTGATPLSDDGLSSMSDGGIILDGGGATIPVDAGSPYSSEVQACISILDEAYASSVTPPTECGPSNETCEEYIGRLMPWVSFTTPCTVDEDCTQMTIEASCGNSNVVVSSCRVSVAFASACEALSARNDHLDFRCGDCGPPPGCDLSRLCVDGIPYCRDGRCTARYVP